MRSCVKIRQGSPALLTLLLGCGGELPPQLLAGQLDLDLPLTPSAVVAMGQDGLRARTDVDASGRFLLALPVDETDSYQLQLQSKAASESIPLLTANGRVRVCTSDPLHDLGTIWVTPGCPPSACERERAGLHDCEVRAGPGCEGAEQNLSSCLAQASVGCLNETAPSGCEQRLCEEAYSARDASCFSACEPMRQLLAQCEASPSQPCLSPWIAFAESPLPPSFGCVMADGQGPGT